MIEHPGKQREVVEHFTNVSFREVVMLGISLVATDYTRYSGPVIESGN